MTKQQVHEILCSTDDKSKMQLAMQCQLNGIDIESLEETLAKALSLVEQAVKPALEYYRYLGGK